MTARPKTGDYVTIAKKGVAIHGWVLKVSRGSLTLANRSGKPEVSTKGAVVRVWSPINVRDAMVRGWIMQPPHGTNERSSK